MNRGGRCVLVNISGLIEDYFFPVRYIYTVKC